MEVCTNPDILKVIYFFMLIINIIKILIPIALIILGTIEFSKAVIISDENSQKKSVNLFIKRLIYAVLIFAMPWIVEVFMETLGDLTADINFTDCIKNTQNISYYESLEESKNENKLYQNTTYLLEKLESLTIKNNEYKNNNTSEKSFIGQKYNLTEYQLKSIAMLCQREQGSTIGAAAEATLMANRFELFGSSYGKGADGLYNYIRNAKWWYNAPEYMDDHKNLNSSVLTAVQEVLVLGKRDLLEPYIDEHDCIYCGEEFGFNIKTIITDGITITDEQSLLNHDNYIEHNTIIYNTMGAKYTFYSFPTETSDPFGYTDEALAKYNYLNN